MSTANRTQDTLDIYQGVAEQGALQLAEVDAVLAMLVLVSSYACWLERHFSSVAQQSVHVVLAVLMSKHGHANALMPAS